MCGNDIRQNWNILNLTFLLTSYVYYPVPDLSYLKGHAHDFGQSLFSVSVIYNAFGRHF